MEKIGTQLKVNDVSYANKLPAEVMGRFLQNLSVEDCLKSERVSPRWKLALSKWGWTEQRKLDANIVFEGATEDEVTRFWKPLNDGSYQLVSMLNRCSSWLRELDLHSFGWENTRRFLPQIVKSIESSRKLEKLNIGGLPLQDFVDHLPSTLRELNTSWWINIKILTLKKLYDRCPNLEEVPFRNLENRNDLQTETLIEFIGKFPRQKKLYLNAFTLRSEKQGALTSFAQLKALEQLKLWNCVSLDGESLEAIVGGCQNLRFLTFDALKLTEGELFQVAKLPNLTALELFDRKGEFSDAVLKAIAQRGQLKKLLIIGSESENASLTDTSVVYLVDRCKSLVSLSLHDCPQISDRSVKAIIVEVQRRHHRTATGTLPSGHLDPGIFYLYCYRTGIDKKRARELIAGNPWMRFEWDPREISYF